MLENVLARRPAAVPPRRRALSPALAAIVLPPVFAVVVAALTATQYDDLWRHGWRVTDHGTVPWPSVLATGPYGWLQIANFALLGVGLLAIAGPLRAALPRTRAARIAAAAVAAQALGLGLAAFPIDVGDASSVTSWVHSWHATLHVTGFLVAGAASVVATGALATAGRRTPGWRALVGYSALCSPVLLAALVASVALTWYLFLLLDLAWMVAVGWRLQAAGTS